MNTFEVLCDYIALLSRLCFKVQHCFQPVSVANASFTRILKYILIVVHYTLKKLGAWYKKGALM